jgi:hypothetical protein
MPNAEIRCSAFLALASVILRHLPFVILRHLAFGIQH